MIRTLSAALGAFLLMVGAALLVFLMVATDADRYAWIQRELSVEPGISEEVMRQYDAMLADYLKGDEAALDGATLFNDREIAHMRDVYALFAAARTVRTMALAVGLLLLFAAFCGNAAWKRAFERGCAIGACLFCAPLAAVGVWAAIDFTGAFDAMHAALFSNELWLLNPETDLMIRMLPEAFFAALAKELAFLSLLAALAVPFAALALTGRARIGKLRVRGFQIDKEDEHDLVQRARSRKDK